MTAYADRVGIANGDGTHRFSTPADAANEDTVAAAISAAWRCEAHRFGPLDPIDFYLTRDGRIKAVVEVKARTHDHGHHPTVFLNVRKWLALQLATVGMGVPALYAVRWTDAIGWVAVEAIDASRFKIGGHRQAVKSHTDVEPVIEIPCEQFRLLTD